LGSSDTHEYSDWQVSTDSTFTNIFSSSIASTVNKTTYTVSGLQPNTTYYVRVRHKGAVLGYSQWSGTTEFSTKASFIPSVEIAKLLAGDAAAIDHFGISVNISNDGNTAVVTIVLKVQLMSMSEMLLCGQNKLSL
jgi:phosphodiesterase/alkaline phosphatase D-like protein